MSTRHIVIYACDAPGCGATDVVPSIDFEPRTRAHRGWFVLWQPGDVNHSSSLHACSAACLAVLAPSMAGWCPYEEWSKSFTRVNGRRPRPLRWRSAAEIPA